MNDDDLRDMFHAQRREDARRAPHFRAMWTKPRKKTPWRLLVPIASVTAAAAVLIVWCRTMQTSSEPPPSAPLAQATPIDWDPAPLDFLLDTPNLAALSGTPSFGKGEK